MDLSTIESKRGELYGHLFENTATGCPLGIYWAISVPFAKSSVLESFGIEWLSWRARRWPELDGVTLGRVSGPVQPEASCYGAGEHQEARVESLELVRGKGATFIVSVRATIPRLFLDDGTKHVSVPLSFSSPLKLLGIDVLPDNISARPRSADAAARCVAEHLDVTDLLAPTWEGFKYVLRPKTKST
jgi:hypothetical protein